VRPWSGASDAATTSSAATTISAGAARRGIDFEAEMRDLQAELGDDWIVRFPVWSDQASLTAERTDGSQHVEATTAGVLMKAAKLLKKRGGRSSD
jgi:hypothetical protein